MTDATPTRTESHDHEAVPVDDVLYCTVHPNVETSLRCNKCGRPMCTKCAVRTPVGYRCKECVRGQQDVYFTAGLSNQVIQALVAIIGSALIGTPLVLLTSRIGLWGYIITFWASSAVGGLIADFAYRWSGRKRGRYSYLIVGGGVAVGSLVGLIASLMFGSFISWGIYAVMATIAALGRLRLGR